MSLHPNDAPTRHDRPSEQPTISEVPSPSPASVALLQSVVWGTDGTRYVTPEAAHDIERLSGVTYFEAHVGGELAGMYAIIPTSLRTDMQRVAAHYRSLLVVDPTRANAGVGRALSAQARRVFFEDAPSPAFLYGYIDALNTRSLRVAERNGYRKLFELTPIAIGWFRPRDADDISVASRAELDELEATFEASWRGHVRGDFRAAFLDGEYMVLRRGGRLLAGAQMSRKILDVLEMEGLSGRALMAAAPLLSKLSATFTVNKRSMLWWGHYFENEPGALAVLFEALQARTRSASGVSYLDPRSAKMVALRKRAFGPHAWAVPGGPKLAVMAAMKGLDEAHWTAPPFVASPLTSA